MTITTDTQHEVSSPEASESTYEGSKDSPAKAGMGLWLAILALGAVMVLAVAAAVGAFDGSSDPDGVTVGFTERPLDLNPHAAASIPVERPLDWNANRVASPPAASIAVESVAYPQAYEEFATGGAAEPVSHPQAYEELVTSDAEERPLDVNPHP
jgi:hypothetical protein